MPPPVLILQESRIQGGPIFGGQATAATGQLKEKLAVNQIDSSDTRAKAKALRQIMQDLAHARGIELRLGKRGG